MNLYTVKCISPQEAVYCCQVETWCEAVTTAHLLAESFGHRANIYKPNETTHTYSATGNPDVTARLFT